MLNKRMIKCQWCETEFDQQYAENFCSKSCKGAHKIDKAIKEETYGKGRCPICKTVFVKHTSNHLYCTTECSKISQIKEKGKVYWDILKRDNFTCLYCGKSSFKDKVTLVVDHIYPLSKGGNAEFWNLGTACDKCNAYKNATILPKTTLLAIWEKTSNPDYILDFPEAVNFWKLNAKHRKKRLNENNLD